MRLPVIFLTVLLLPFSARGFTLVDPFVNPIKLKEAKLKKLKELEEKLREEKREVKLFRPAVPRPLEELSIQGVISSGKGYRLVVLDPETGETYILKEGDAISPSEKLVKITPSKLVVVQYFYRAGRLRKTYRTVKVNLEG